MSSQESRPSIELQLEIQAFQQQFLPKVPPQVSATLQKATADLIQSGIAEKSLRVGDKAPDFALPNVQGKTVKLAELLSRGPVVVAFYRGEW